MTVLSLFDGMSCGQIALRELGITVDRYYASEINRHTIRQTQLNFPDTVQLGDVRNVRAKDLPKIDLLIGGSPCQGFSFAGKRLNFNDPRSALFFEFVRILNECREVNPDVLFMLENVRMKREHERVISDTLGLNPVMINSALVSAQNRVRLYWSNIRTAPDGLFEIKTDIPQPGDRGLFLRDILEDEVDAKYYLSDKVLRNMFRHKERNEQSGNGFGIDIRRPSQKSCALKVGGRGVNDVVAIIQRLRGANKGGTFTDKSPTLSANAWEQNNMVVSGQLRRDGFREIKSGKAACLTNRARNDGSGQNIVARGGLVRRLTPKKCARLQTIPDWYRWGCSDTQAYAMLGNGWTVEVIKHIFSFLPK